MKFTPYFDKVQIEPKTQDVMLRTDDTMMEEMGTVIAIGKDVKFLKVGDTVFFSSWGSNKTTEIDKEGKRYYVVTESSQFILGKYANGRARKSV